MINIAIFASGNGTNAENITRYFSSLGSDVRVRVLLVDRKDAGALGRLRALGVECCEYIVPSVWKSSPEEIVGILRKYDIGMIVLAGFLRYVSPVIIDAFPDAVVNIHPSLLPAYGGKGMYGDRVHEAVVAAGEKESGVTVHYVDSEMDHGDIIMQEKLTLNEGETPESLAARIHQIEYSLYPRAIEETARRLEARKEAAKDEKPAHGAAVPPPVPVEELWARRMKMEFDPAKAAQEEPQAPVPAKADTAAAPPAVKFRLPSEPQPPTYILGAVLVTIFCCLPVGIAALVFSSSVNSRYLRGDLAGARKASERAKWCIIAAFAIGLVAQSIMIPVMLFTAG